MYNTQTHSETGTSPFIATLPQEPWPAATREGLKVALTNMSYDANLKTLHRPLLQNAQSIKTGMGLQVREMKRQ